MNISEGLSIYEEGGHFFLALKEFDNLTSADEVRHLAIEIIKTFDKKNENLMP
jgi:hypothetical protein